MLRKGNYKYTYFAEGYEPQLFDLENDQFETNDLSKNPQYQKILDEFYTDLTNICDPESVNIRAKKEQKAKIDMNGGIEKIKARGDFGYSPAPGQKAKFD